MNNRKLGIVGVAAAALMLSSPALADDETTSELGDDVMTPPEFAEVDANGDNAIDETEFSIITSETDQIAVYDADGDGMLDEDEYREFQTGWDQGQQGASGSTAGTEAEGEDDSGVEAGFGAETEGGVEGETEGEAATE